MEENGERERGREGGEKGGRGGDREGGREGGSRRSFVVLQLHLEWAVSRHCPGFLKRLMDERKAEREICFNQGTLSALLSTEGGLSSWPN